ncbi:MAG: hypothetical protein A2Z16_07755 [Chloroflexi bacterium RBG_16_54_18]|nr:MAG: hypothetical protein A2Z16_07755 [Chloroflexi bacterium RBG_16_54_18]
MGLIWPGFLWLLGLIPLIILVYFLIQRRRKRYVVRYSSLVLIRAAIPKPSLLRRYLPIALFLLALASLVLALTRPVAVIKMPAGKATIMLAMDVSMSMCSTDIPPNRLKAAQAAALEYVQRQSAHTQLGIVAFAGFAALVQPPTSDQEDLIAAVENLYTARRTAIGSAILESLDAIAEINQAVAPSTTDSESDLPTPVPEGEYAADIIVLLTDGASNTGIWPLEAAQQAADRGVRVYTIGFGTENGAVSNCGWGFQGGNSFGGGQPQWGNSWYGGGFRRGIDEETLKQVASLTGGEYFSAQSASELTKVFEDLPTYLITRNENMEISVLFTIIGAILAVLAISLSLLWHPIP